MTSPAHRPLLPTNLGHEGRLGPVRERRGGCVGQSCDKIVGRRLKLRLCTVGDDKSLPGVGGGNSIIAHKCVAVQSCAGRER